MKMWIHEMDGVREIIEGGTGGKNGGARREKKTSRSRTNPRSHSPGAVSGHASHHQQQVV